MKFQSNAYMKCFLVTLRTFDALQRVQLGYDAMTIDPVCYKGLIFREVLHLHENARRGRLDFHTAHIAFSCK